MLRIFPPPRVVICELFFEKETLNYFRSRIRPFSKESCLEIDYYSRELRSIEYIKREQKKERNPFSPSRNSKFFSPKFFRQSSSSTFQSTSLFNVNPSRDSTDRKK